jgi:hypothetical protein
MNNNQVPTGAEKQFADVIALSLETASNEAKIRRHNAKHSKEVAALQEQLCETVRTARKASVVFNLYGKRVNNIPIQIVEDSMYAGCEQGLAFERLRKATSHLLAMGCLNAAYNSIRNSQVLAWEEDAEDPLGLHLKLEADERKIAAAADLARRIAARSIDADADLARRIDAEERRIAADADLARRIAADDRKYAAAPKISVDGVETYNTMNQVAVSAPKGRVTITDPSSGTPREFMIADMGTNHGGHRNLCGYLSLSNGDGDFAVYIKKSIAYAADKNANKAPGHFAKHSEMMTEESLRAYVKLFETSVSVVSTNSRGVHTETHLVCGTTTEPMVYIINLDNH